MNPPDCPMPPRLNPIILLVAALAVLAFAFQGSRGLFAPDEGFYVVIAQAMADSGDYLVPRLSQDPWLDKPPLTMWGIAAGLRVLGRNEWAARAFHGLCFMLTAGLVFSLGRMIGGMRVGLLGAVLFATMLLPFVAGNIVTPDLPLTACTTAAFVCFWKSLRPDERRVLPWKMLLAAALGLAFLAKGPAALVPAGAMFLFLICRGRVRRYLLSPWIVPGLALFAAVGLGWYAAVAHRLPDALAYFWDNQLWGRTFSVRYARNPGFASAWIYAAAVLLGALPWSLYWAAWVRRGWAAPFRASAWIRLWNDPVRLFLAVWIAAPLAVYCLASSKLPLYALPIFPALALATAKQFAASPPEKAWRGNPLGFSRLGLAALGLWVALLIGLKAVAAHYPTPQDTRMLQTALAGVLPDGPLEIVPVGEHLEGLGFYSGAHVERVTARKTPYPFYVLPEHLDEEIAEMPKTRYGHVYVVKGEKYAKLVRKELQSAGIPFHEHALPFRRAVFDCPSIKTKKPICR